MQERVTVLEGDLVALPPLPDDIDVLIHSASTVSFDLPIDEAFTANVGGPLALYEALLATGADPHVVHVSTSYVAGLRKGVAEERALDHTVDRELEFAHALAAREEAEATSRRPAVLSRLLAEAQAEHRRAGAPGGGGGGRAGPPGLGPPRAVEAGRTRANTLGWTDVYTFTKALGERVAEDLWAGNGHRLSVVRPTIIESALKHPYPGWIDGFKVADPLIAAYGRGMLPEFPALADTVLDVIPVDFVVNAILAAAAAPPPAGQTSSLPVSSGLTNPLPLGHLVRLVREYFKAHPLTDAEGAHVAVPAWSFPHTGAVERALRRRQRVVGIADKAVGRLPATERTRGWISGLYRARRDLGTLRKFTNLYQPYTQTEVVRRRPAAGAARRAAAGASGRPRLRRHRDRLARVPPGRAHPQRARAHAQPRRRVLPVGAGRARRAHRRRRRLRPAAHRGRGDARGEVPCGWRLAAKPATHWPASLANLVALGPRYLQAERRDRGGLHPHVHAALRGRQRGRAARGGRQAGHVLAAARAAPRGGQPRAGAPGGRAPHRAADRRDRRLRRAARPAVRPHRGREDGGRPGRAVDRAPGLRHRWSARRGRPGCAATPARRAWT